MKNDMNDIAWSKDRNEQISSMTRGHISIEPHASLNYFSTHNQVRDNV